MRPRKKRSGVAIVETLKLNPVIFSYNCDGNSVIEGVAVPGANIDDIIHYCLNQFKKQPPIDSNEFLRAIGRTEIGLHNLANKAAKAIVGQVRSGAFTNQSTPTRPSFGVGVSVSDPWQAI